MPRRRYYTTTTAKDFLLRYGYDVPNDFAYNNLNEKVRLYDLVNEQYVNLSINQVEYRVRVRSTHPE